ncbi:MAG: SMC-Scp complex subunit ScpB [Thermoplasmata archaeon]|nr:SMC-Scp complex subunit ScpB [Thermoplasmata archaeon]
MPSKVDDLVLKLEALLFASGRPLSVRQLSDALGHADSRSIPTALRSLAAAYDGRQTALELRRVGDRYAIQLREPFVAVARVVTPLDMAPRTLKTLTLIAYHQPMLQSVLAKMLGDAVYEEVQRLRSAGLIRTEPKGSTLELTTTRLFAEQFGIPSTRPEEIRQFLEKKLGVVPSTVPTEGAVLDTPSDASPALALDERENGAAPASL